MFSPGKLTGRALEIVVILGLAAVFGLGLLVPYEIGSDLAFQVRAVETWLAGWSSSPVSLAFASPADLSRDDEAWIVWWPPGALALFFLQLLAGWDAAAAVRMGAFLCACLGGVGWLRFARSAGAGPTAVAGAALLAVLHGAFGGGAVRLGGADVLGYAVMPWLMISALKLAVKTAQGAELRELVRRALALGLGVGLLFWLKYSAFLCGVGILLFLVFALLGALRRGRRLELAATMVSLLVPVALCVGGLLWLNESRGGSEGTIEQAAKSSDFASGFVRTPGFAVEVAGAAGITMFGASQWMTHVLHFAEVPSELERLRERVPPGLAKGSLGLLGSLVLAWSLAANRGGLAWRARLLVGCCCACLFFALTAASLALSYDLIGNEAGRLAMGLLPAMQIAVLDAGGRAFSRSRKAPTRLGIGVLAMALIVMPLAFSAAVFGRIELLRRMERAVPECGETLWLPQQRDMPEHCLWQRVGEAVAGADRAVVVLAIPDGSGTSMGSALGRPFRILPLGYFLGPLVDALGPAGRIHAQEKLTTAVERRAAVVIGEGLSVPGLLSRFPGAHEWHEVTAVQGAPRVFWTDLRSAGVKSGGGLGIGKVD